MSPAPNNPARPSLQARLLQEQQAAEASTRPASQQPITHATEQIEVSESLSLGNTNPELRIGERSVLNPNPLPDPNAEPREVGFAPEQLADLAAAIKHEVSPEIVDILIEALLGWRASLHGTLFSVEKEPTLNPGSFNETKKIIKQGISQAEDLATTLAPFGTQALRAAKAQPEKG